MSRTTQIHITLEQLDKWSLDNGHNTSKKYANIENYIWTCSMRPPKQLLRRLYKLVHDEAVDPMDIVLWVTDETTGEQYSYTPRIVDIFSHVHEPVHVETAELSGLFN